MIDRSKLLALAVLTVALLGLVPAALAQDAPETPSVETLLSRHAEALGGLERLDQVESLRWTGTWVAFSEEGTFTLTRLRPDRYRLEYEMLGEGLVEGYDGDDAWTIHPLMGIPAAVTMSDSERAAVQAQADFFGPLIRPEAKGHEVTLVGRSDFEGTDAWELTVTRADGTEETWFLDAETYLPVGRRSVTTDWGRPHPLTVFYDDWREVEGIRLPFYWENEFFIRHQIVEVDEVEVNPEVDPALFDRPVPEPRTRLARLGGTWEVAVETRPFPQAPWTEGAGAAEIETKLGGALLIEQIQYEDQGRPIEAVRTWSWDRDDEVYRVTHTDDFTGSTQVLEGTWNEEDGTLVLTPPAEAPAAPEGSEGEEAEDGEDAAPAPPPGPRWTVSEVTDDGFLLERAVSQDGETWNVTHRFRYGKGSSEE